MRSRRMGATRRYGTSPKSVSDGMRWRSTRRQLAANEDTAASPDEAMVRGRVDAAAGCARRRSGFVGPERAAPSAHS